MTVRQQFAMDIFVRERYAVPGAAAIVGAISGESGINLDATINRVHADHGSGGIAEWRLDRKTKMVSFVRSRGKPDDDLESQCLFIINELSRIPNLNAELRAGTVQNKDVVGAITTMCWNFVELFERPNMAVAHMDDIRVPQAIKVYNAYQSASHQTLPPIATGGIVVGGGAGTIAYDTAGQVPPMATIIMTAFSVISGIIGLFNVKSPPSPLPVPETDAPKSAPAQVSLLDNFKAKLEALKVAQHEVDEARKALTAFADEMNEALASVDIKIIEHEPTKLGS